ARGSFDPQRLSGALANPFLTYFERVRRKPIVAKTSEASLTFATLHPLMIICTRIRETDQIFAHAENKSADMESAMTFKQGVSGTHLGNRHRTRHLLNQEFMQALLLHFRQHGKKAIEKVAREQPASYLKILGLLVPREHKVEHTNPLKKLTDEQLEAMIEYIETSLAAQAGAPAKMIEGTIEPISVELQRGPLLDSPNPKNRVMLEADAAVGPRERMPRKVRLPLGS